MSYKATGWAYDLPITGPQKFVLVALADMADEAGSCFPGQERLAQMTGLSRSTVKRSLEKLEDAELIRRERRTDRYGHRTSDRYFLALDRQSLGVSVPSRQSAYKADSASLGVSVLIPRGQSDPLTISGSSSDPSGGGEDAPTPAPELSPYCKRHQAAEGSDKPCTACKQARLAWEQALVTADREQQWVPVTPKVSKHWKPGMCREHLKNAETCEMCAYERSHPQTAGSHA